MLIPFIRFRSLATPVEIVCQVYTNREAQTQTEWDVLYIFGVRVAVLQVRTWK